MGKQAWTQPTFTDCWLTDVQIGIAAAKAIKNAAKHIEIRATYPIECKINGISGRQLNKIIHPIGNGF